MPDQLSRQVKEERTRRLIIAGTEIQQDYESRLIGTECEILAEECIEERRGQNPPDVFLEGYTPEYVRICVPFGSDPAAAQKRIGQLVRVKPCGFREDRILLASHTVLR